MASAREVLSPAPANSGEAPLGKWLRPVYTGERHYYPQPEAGFLAICGATTRLARPIQEDGTAYGRQLTTCRDCWDLLSTMNHKEASE